MAKSKNRTIFVVNGPNLNLLGEREPDIYGSATLGDLEKALKAKATALGVTLDFRQSNHEGVLVDWCQEAANAGAGLIINAGGYSHTSVAIRDAVAALEIPVVEVHLSNIHGREPFRQVSLLSAVSSGVVCGFGAQGYHFALEALAEKLT